MSLREIRKDRGWLPSELSKRSGVNKQMIQFYENGTKDINGARLKTLLKLCSALNCKLSDIVTDPETVKMLKEMGV